MSLTKERSFYLDNVKSVLIFFVVIGHFAEEVVDYSPVFKSIFLWLYTFHMPLFIFITGYLNKKTVKDKKRLSFKCFEYVILYFLMKFSLDFIEGICKGSRISFSLLGESSVPWYLLSMALMFLLSYALRNTNQKFVFVFFVLLALFIGYDKETRDILTLSRTIVFYPAFLLGLNCNEKTLNKICNNKKLIPIAIAVILITLGIAYLFPDFIYEFRPLLTARNPYTSLETQFEDNGMYYRLALYVIGLLISLSFLIITPKIPLGFFSKIGSRTLAIYFFHRHIIWILYKFEVYSTLQDICGSFIGNCLWLLFACLTTLILSTRIFEIPFIRLHKVLLKNDN